MARVVPAEADAPRMGSLGRVHILLAVVGVAVFALAAVLALLYLFEDRQLKRKRFDRVVGRVRRSTRSTGWRCAACRLAFRSSRSRS